MALWFQYPSSYAGESLKSIRGQRPASSARRGPQDFFKGVGEDEIVEVDGVDRGTVRTAMDSGLAKVDALGAFCFELLVEDHCAVEPQPCVAFVTILRPMDVHH